MGEIQNHKPVMLLLAVTSRYDEGLDWTVQQAESRFGPVADVSQRFAFNETQYYLASMGDDLKKQLIVFTTLIDPAEIADIKRLTNEWESAFKSANDYEEARPVNIDPGYLTEAKLVLATTKDRDHRIYLRDGIYAEVTLHYRGKRWQSSRWTYDDYQRDDFQEFLTACRGQLSQRYRELRAAEAAE